MVDFAPLRCMKSLTHLDLSFSFHESFSYKSLLADPHWLPNLEALDISGEFDLLTYCNSLFKIQT